MKLSPKRFTPHLQYNGGILLFVLDWIQFSTLEIYRIEVVLITTTHWPTL